MANEDLTAIVKELAMIRKLLVFGLMNAGASQQKVARALGIDQSQISRMFSATKPTSKKR
jgi:predicted transcriptional regulator